MTAAWADISQAEAIGKRSSQQDCAAYVSLPPLEGADERLLVVLADGMGGHAAGDVASKTAVNAFMAETQLCSSSHASEILQRGMGAAAKAVQAKAASDAALREMGTTLVAGLVEKTGAGVAVRWVSAGDSPLWRVSAKGELERLNADQSLAGQLEAEVKAGRISLADADKDPRRAQSNVLTFALMAGPFDIASADLRLEPVKLNDGDMLLFASDGVESLPEQGIGRALTSKRKDGAAGMTRALLKAVEKRKAPRQDNVMLVVVDASPQFKKRGLFG